MPSFMKDELRKKDEEKLEAMKQEIDEAVSSKDADSDEKVPDDYLKGANDMQGRSGEEEPVEEVPEGDAPQEQEPVDEKAALQKQVEQLTAQLQESESSLKRLRADFENFRRRTTKEKEEIGVVVVQGLFKDMLPLLDNFERAMASEDKGGENFQKGVAMIFTQFQEILKKNGLEPIETKDAKFDPNFHQAVMRVENPDMEDESIAAELQKGYIVKGRVIRPSMVQVVAN